jgi:DNA polymerase-3 subunit alpha/error-prone DNA polymerase
VDGLGLSRPAALLQLQWARQGGRRVKVAQDELFAHQEPCPAVPDYSARQRWLAEWRVLGFSVRQPLLALLRPELPAATTADSRDLAARIGHQVTLAGLLETRQEATTSRGEAMWFATFSDEYGLFEVNLYPGLVQRLRGRLGYYGPYLVTGTVESQYGALAVTAAAIELAHGTGAPEWLEAACTT